MVRLSCRMLLAAIAGYVMYHIAKQDIFMAIGMITFLTIIVQKN